MFFRFAIVFAALAPACAKPVVEAPPPIVVLAELDSLATRCAEASRLREEGFEALNGLRLEAARKAYMRSLQLDPGNRGVLYQLDVIDALGEDRPSVGTHADNHSLYSASRPSPCQKFEAHKTHKPPRNGPPEIVQSGQIISFAKGEAQDRDLLAHDDLRDAVAQARQELLDCYTDGLGDNPELRGEFTAKLMVEGDGKVSAVFLESNTVEEASVERCIEAAFSKVVFPKRRSHMSLSVLVPMSLQLGDAEAQVPQTVKAAAR